MRPLPVVALPKTLAAIAAALLLSTALPAAAQQDAAPAATAAEQVTPPYDLMVGARRLLATGDARDAARAAQLLESAVAAGVPWAVVPLADLYRTGLGVAADPARARALYEDALKAGDVRDAAYGLGLLSQDDPDTTAALDLFARAAAAGNPDALLAAAEIWRTGRGVAADPAKAAALYESAVAAGRDGDGAYGLGQIRRAPGPLHDSTAAIAWFGRAAAAGRPEGLVALGDMYRIGDGVAVDPTRAKGFYDQALAAGAERDAALGLGFVFMTGPQRDPARAIGYFNLSASLGNVPALVALGDVYRRGDGVPVDPDKARGYYQQALAAGDVARGAEGLGVLALADGPGRDPAVARGYFEQAAAAGSAAAMVALGDLWRTGDGVEADAAKARAYYEQAMAAGEASDAPYGLGLLARDAATPDMTAAVDFLDRAAAAGNGRAMIALGDLFWSGQGIPADIGRAKDYYTQALATPQAADAAYGLGRYYRAPGPQHDAAQALIQLGRAADAGNGAAMTALGDMYRTGDGVGIDHEAAAGYYERAVAAGAVRDAAYGLGVVHWQSGALQDPAAAADDFARAAAAGNPWATVALGDLARTGFGMAADPAKAKGYYEQALDGPAGRDAAYGLGQIYAAGPLADAGAAVAAFERAAAAGRGDALVAMADLYREGRPGLAADPARAEGLYQQAIDAGQVGPARYGLALLALAPGAGRSVPAAVAHLEAAIAAGNTPAMLRLGDLYRTGDGIDADPAQAKTLYEKAVTWGAKLEGATGLGLLYAAPGPMRNMRVALGYLDYAAEEGEPGAMIALGDLYRTGAGVRASATRAETLYTQALDAGLTAAAHYGLAELYLRGPLRDPALARANFEAAAEAGDGRAVLALARLDGADPAQPGGTVESYQRAAALMGPDAAADAVMAAGQQQAVMLAQALLAERGFDPGPVDGAAGRRTVAAVTAFCAADAARACADAGGAVTRAVIAALLTP